MGGAAEIVKLGAMLMTFVAVTVGIYVVLRTRTQKATIRSGLADALLTSPSVAHSRKAVMSHPFGERVLGRAVKGAAGLVYRFGPTGLADHLRRRLVVAGLSHRLNVDTFLAASLSVPVVTFAVLIAANAAGRVPLFLWLAVPISAFAPKMWLTGKVESRQKQVRLALADTIDLLTIAVEAGLGFDAAIARVVSAIPGPLSDELYRMLQELKIGVPRNQALRGLAERTDVEDLDQFITAVSQADTFGIAVSNVLRVQAKQIRQKRSQVAEEKAAKTPVKLLFPLLLCIFPALFTVLVGPAAIKIVDSVFGKI